MLPLVLLPGMMCDARLWRSQLVGLGAHRAVQIAPITNHDNVEALAAEILATAPPTFALAGLSMGGIVAMEVMRQAPKRVEKLALLDTNPRAETPEVQALRAPQIARAQQGEMLDVMREAMIPRYLASGHEPGKKAMLTALAENMATTLGADVFIRQSRALRDRPDQQDMLKTITVPTLILMGAEDQLCPRDRHDLMHALIPHSRLEIIEGAGHLPVLETPERVTTAMASWLES